jgi:hypothetical protein
MIMNTATLDPRVSEFETEEQASSYDQWFRAKVQEAPSCRFSQGGTIFRTANGQEAASSF